MDADPGTERPEHDAGTPSFPLVLTALHRNHPFPYLSPSLVRMFLRLGCHIPLSKHSAWHIVEALQTSAEVKGIS